MHCYRRIAPNQTKLIFECVCTMFNILQIAVVESSAVSYEKPKNLHRISEKVSTEALHRIVDAHDCLQ